MPMLELEVGMKNQLWKLVLCLICVVTLVASGAGAKDLVVISGAGLLGEVLQDYADAFRTANPSCDVVVIGKDTSKGFQDLAEGSAQFAMATRQILAEERDNAGKKGISLGEKYLGKISLVVITNASNSVDELSLEQLKKIFTVEITDWRQCGGPQQPITVTMRAVPQTGAGVEFQKIVMGGAPYSKSATVMSLYKDTVTACRKSMAIGYIPTTSVFFKRMDTEQLKAIRVKNDATSHPVFPSEGVVAETTYPITIPFYLYWNTKTASDCVPSFAAFAQKMSDSRKIAEQ